MKIEYYKCNNCKKKFPKNRNWGEASIVCHPCNPGTDALYEWIEYKKLGGKYGTV